MDPPIARDRKISLTIPRRSIHHTNIVKYRFTSKRLYKYCSLSDIAIFLERSIRKLIVHKVNNTNKASQTNRLFFMIILIEFRKLSITYSVALCTLLIIPDSPGPASLGIAQRCKSETKPAMLVFQ